MRKLSESTMSTTHVIAPRVPIAKSMDLFHYHHTTKTVPVHQASLRYHKPSKMYIVEIEYNNGQTIIYNIYKSAAALPALPQLRDEVYLNPDVVAFRILVTEINYEDRLSRVDMIVRTSGEPPSTVHYRTMKDAIDHIPSDTLNIQSIEIRRT